MSVESLSEITAKIVLEEYKAASNEEKDLTLTKIKKIYINLLAEQIPITNYLKEHNDNLTINLSKGEIRKLDLIPEHQRIHKLGDILVFETAKFIKTWVHIHDDYFKLVSKTINTTEVERQHKFNLITHK